MIAVKSNENERKFVKVNDGRNCQKPSVYAGLRHFAQLRESLKGYFEPCYPHHKQSLFCLPGQKRLLMSYWNNKCKNRAKASKIGQKQAKSGFKAVNRLLRSLIFCFQQSIITHNSVVLYDSFYAASNPKKCSDNRARIIGRLRFTAVHSPKLAFYSKKG